MKIPDLTLDDSSACILLSRVRCLRPMCEIKYTWHLISKNNMTGREVLGEVCVKLDFSSTALSRYLVVHEKGLKCNFFHLIPSWSQEFC